MVDFKALRKKCGLTQAELAEKVGVSENTIQNWESGKIIPKGENFNNYLRELRITDQAEVKRIFSNLTEASYIKNLETVDYVPYFLFDDKPEQVDKIKNCYASAQELDMLGYADYLIPKGRAIGDVRIAFPMEFAFFEKHGGFNQTMKIMHEARLRLGRLVEDAINFAKENPGCDYRLVSMEKETIIYKLGIFVGNKKLREKINELYGLLKTIDSVGTSFHNYKNFETRMNKTREITVILNQYYRNMSENRSFDKLEGYIRSKDESPTKIDLSIVELTERGKLLIDMVESNEYSIRNVV